MKTKSYFCILWHVWAWAKFANINIAHFSVLYCHLPLRTNQLDEKILIIPLPPNCRQYIWPSWWRDDPGLLAVDADLARSRSPPRNLGCRLQVKTWYDRARMELIVTVLSAVDLASRTGGQHRYGVWNQENQNISIHSVRYLQEPIR